MASITCLKTLMLALIIASALGKNFSPPAARHRFSGGTSHEIEARNGAPVAAGSPAARERNTTVSADHIFYENYQTSLTWARSSTPHDLGPSHELQARDGNIIKRAPGSSPGDPLFKLPSCLGCLQAVNEPGKVTIDTLNTDYLERQMLTTAVDLLNKCVFYTSVPRAFMDIQEWFDRRALGGANEHPGLSKIATDYACRNNLLTIWNMYSGANDVTNAPQKPFSRNYWEVYTPGSWLNFLPQQGKQFTYFENMSRAMARRCGGVVGGSYAPQILISIDAADPRNQFFLDFETQEVISPVRKRDPYYLDVDGLLGKRATCDANLNYEQPDEDWFG
ncbi:hypothetical protein PG988_007810 [Apiospora saccharicola]